MKRIALILIVSAVLIYFFSYVWLRQTHTEVWEKDNNAYVIFPVERTYLYYFYRPLTYVDGAVTGMRFHIGQHR